MLRQWRVASLASLFALASLASAGAQDFLATTAETIPNKTFELSANPTWLLGKNDGPDRFGGAFRAGYGISDSFDVVGKAGVFDDFSLVGVGAEYWFLRGSVDMLAGVGVHKALIQGANDTTSFDVSWLASGRVSDRLTLAGGVSASFESIDDAPDSAVDSDFTRVYVGPALRYRVSDRVDFVTQAGIGLNDNSPSYLAFGVSTYLPTGGASGRAGRR